MSVFTKAAAVRTARWFTVPAIAAAAVAVAAGPALAEGTAVGITTYGATAYAGQLYVSGAYQCSTDTPYDYLKVTVSQDTSRGTVTGTEYLAMPCTGGTLTWQATVSPNRGDEWFGDGDARVDVALWAPDNYDGRATASLVLWA